MPDSISPCNNSNQLISASSYCPSTHAPSWSTNAQASKKSAPTCNTILMVNANSSKCEKLYVGKYDRLFSSDAISFIDTVGEFIGGAALSGLLWCKGSNPHVWHRWPETPRFRAACAGASS